MISKDELLESARIFGIGLDVVEKDYVLGWFLVAINQDKDLRGSWIFKGGTCLKKCFLETDRFSEDLDFTLKEASYLNEGYLVSKFREISKWLYEYSGIEIPEEAIKFEVYKNRSGSPAAQGKIAYNGPSKRKIVTSLPRVKFDLLADELIVTDTVESKIKHSYSDYQEELFIAQSYSYVEIFAEKLRALSERGRPRDLYDVVHIYNNEVLRPSHKELFRVLALKCDFKKANLPTKDLVKSADRLVELRADWDSMLSHQLSDLPSVDYFLGELDKLLAWLFEEVDE